MTETNYNDEILTAADKVDYHREEAMAHADKVEGYLEALYVTPRADRRDTLLNQQIGVHLKLADVHARLAVAVSSRNSDCELSCTVERARAYRAASEGSLKLSGR